LNTGITVFYTELDRTLFKAKKFLNLSSYYHPGKWTCRFLDG
jgi:hypothetical protein